MKDKLIIISIFLSILLNAFFINNDLLQLFFWVIISILTYLSIGKYYERNKYKDLIFKYIIIFTAFYYIIYYLLGLVFGYLSSPFNHTLFGIIVNVFKYVIIIILKQYVHYQLIKNNNNNFLITLLFILSYLNYNVLLNLDNTIDLFKYICYTTIPIICTTSVSTYLSINSDLKTVSIYQITPTLITYLIPIIPDFNWFYHALYNIFCNLSLYLFIRYKLLKFNKENKIRNIKKENPIRLTPYFIILIISIAFTMGMFKYVPISVASNSMYPVFERGDALIYKKTNDITELKVGDIICYQKDKIIVMHRITNIESINNKTYITTKGDNLDHNDIKKVMEKDIIGIIKIVIPKIGYPSVWIYEFLNT